MIVLVNPVSSGTALADAFDERGSDCLHVYDTGLAPSAPDARVVVHHDIDETLRTLESRGVTAVVAASEFGVTLADRLASGLGLPDLPLPRRRAGRVRRHLRWTTRQSFVLTAGVVALSVTNA